MSTQNPPKKKVAVQLPFALPKKTDAEQDASAHNHVRPKPEQYADKTWPPPRGTRRSMGKR
jgi:hypothetical protein